MKRIVIVEEKDIHFYPPLMNVVRILLDNGHDVTLISKGSDLLPQSVLSNERYHYELIYAKEDRRNDITKLFSRIALAKELKRKINKNMLHADLLWTGSIQTLRDSWRTVRKYKNILQLMELCETGYVAHGIKFPLDKVARDSFKVVVAEKNRAYIEKAWWDLKYLPTVFPNKPYSLDYGEISSGLEKSITKMKTEKRKVILYLGGIFADRELEEFARAIYEKKDEYVLYVAGKAYNSKLQKSFDECKKKYGIEYLGYFDPPQHLALVQYAFIGILPYKTVHVKGQSSLNALYCAPNKIFEYAGFGIPMLGSDVLGLSEPFSTYNIGLCWDGKDTADFHRAIKEIERNYALMSQNCKDYYNSVDIEKIVMDIIAE